MTTRGGACKDHSPDTNYAKSKTRHEEIKQVSQGKEYQETDFTEGRQNGTSEEQKPREQKKTNHTEVKQFVQSIQKEKTTKRFKEEITKQQRTPTDKTKATVQGTKAKNSAGRVKTTEQSAEEIKMQPQTRKDTTKDCLKTTKAKTCGGKTKSQVKFSEMTKMQPETSKDTTKDCLKTTKAKTCGGKTKSRVKFSEMTKTQPETPKDTTKDCLKTTKAKTHGGKAKSPLQFAEEATKTQPETPKDTTNASVQITKAKTRAGKTKSPQQDTKIQQEILQDTTKAIKAKRCAAEAKSPEKFTEKKTKKQPQKGTTKACLSRDICEDKAAVDSVLYTTLEKLKIRQNDRSDAAEVINKIIKNIIMHLKQNSECFKEVEEPLRTGSYYENLKISNPDEFDVMLPIPVDRVNIETFGDDGAFYSVGLKRGTSPLQKFQENSTLSASKMLKEFRDEVKKSVKEFREWEVTKKKIGCPAVTLITKVQSTTISLDVVLSLMVQSSWPPFTKEGLKIEGWLGTKVKQEFKRKAYFLVPKYEGRGAVENNGVLAKDIWRVSFSHVEKAILKNHGSEKTCCEKNGTRCCRKDCLKLLKHLLSLLKERDSTFDKFCSYHAKTALLHACCSRTKDSDWSTPSLSQCFQLFLEDFVDRLESGVLYNFFIPTQNLLSSPGQRRCNSLASCIREECAKGFPIFK